MANSPDSEAHPNAPGTAERLSLGRMLKDAWQIPLLVAAVAGIVGAAWYARAHRAENEWNATLAQATEQIDKGELAIAHVILDEVITPHLADAPEGFVPRFDAVRADLASAELAHDHDHGKTPTAVAYEEVAKLYEHAIEAKAELTDAQLARYSAALLGAGRPSDAIAAAEEAGDAEHAQKLASRFGRKKLEDAYAAARAPGKDRKVVEAFFAEYEEFRAAPRIGAADRAWAATLAARVRLDGGHAEAATERLLLELPRAQNASAAGEHVAEEQFAELWYLLGEGYRQQGRHGDAEHALETAYGMTAPSSRLAGEIDLALGQVKLALDAPEKAHEVFDRAVLAEHPDDLKPGHILGRARARAELGQNDDSLRDFDALLALAEKDRLPKDVAAGMLASLNDLARSALGEEHFAEAIEYAERAVELRDKGQGGAAAFVTLAEAAYRRAREMRDAEAERAGSASELDPGVRAEINRMFRRGGEAFAMFLQTDLARELPAPERSELQFSAGDCFDCAGEQALALGHFERSLAELPEGDSKRTERLLRIGDIHAHAQAYDKAQDAYEGVYRITRNDPRVAMPLCKVLVAADQVPRALAELRRILEGNAGLRPDSEQYREALDLFAKLSFARGDFGASADRLTELVERDPDHPQSGERHFRLGQSLQEISRLAAAESKTDDLTTARRAQLERSARDRAVDAQRAYQRAIEILESHTRALDGLGRDMLRNAYLQRAHCAFDRGQFKEAIDFYETVDRKYPEEAASVLALVQIVNAADALGDAQRAEAAHTRALRRIDSLPDDALLGDGGVLGRDDWRNWLRNHPPGSHRIAGAGTPAGEEAP